MRRGALVAALLVSASGCNNLAQTDPATAQQLVEFGDALNVLRDDISALQERNDSLTAVVARTDSIVRTLANLAGVTVSPRP